MVTAAIETRPTAPVPGSRAIRPTDPATLIEAYGACRDAAYSVAYRILGDGAAAEDAVQETFLKLSLGAARFDPSRGSIRGFVMLIVRHTSIDIIRRRLARQRTETTYCTGETWTSDGPERATECAESARDVRGALLDLPDGQRRAIEMAYFSGLTRREIAARMGVPIGTVKSRMRLGMRTLAVRLADRDLREASMHQTALAQG